MADALDQFLAATEPQDAGRGDALDQFLAATAQPQFEQRFGRVPTGDDPGEIESFLRGGLQGVTLGFADEIAGAVESALGDKTFKQARDESRAEFRRAQEANPISFGAGSVASAFAPGLGAVGAVARGARAATAVGRATQLAKAGAVTGGISGIGASEADNLEGAAIDAATGVVVGGAGAAILGSIVQGAGQRLRASVSKTIANGATPGAQRAISRQSDDIARVVLGDKELRAASGFSAGGVVKGVDHDKLAQRSKELIVDLAEGNTKTYAAVDRAGHRVRLGDVAEELAEGRAKFRSDPKTFELGDALDDVEERMFELFNRGKNEATKVGNKEFRSFVTQIQDQAFKKALSSVGPDPQSITRAMQIRQDATRFVKDVFNKHLQSAAQQTPKLAKDVDTLLRVNSDISALSGVNRLAQQIIDRQATGPGLTSKLGAVADIGLLASGNVPVVTAARALAPRAARAINLAGAALEKAAEKGATRAQLLERGLRLGLSVRAAQTIVDSIQGRDQPMIDDGAELDGGASALP